MLMKIKFLLINQSTHHLQFVTLCIKLSNFILNFQTDYVFISTEKKYRIVNSQIQLLFDSLE